MLRSERESRSKPPAGETPTGRRTTRRRKKRRTRRTRTIGGVAKAGRRNGASHAGSTWSLGPQGLG